MIAEVGDLPEISGSVSGGRCYASVIPRISPLDTVEFKRHQLWLYNPSLLTSWLK